MLSHDDSGIHCGPKFRMSSSDFWTTVSRAQCWITLIALHITVSKQLYMRNLIRYARHFQFAILLSTTIWYCRWDSNQQRISTLNREVHVQPSELTYVQMSRIVTRWKDENTWLADLYIFKIIRKFISAARYPENLIGNRSRSLGNIYIWKIICSR